MMKSATMPMRYLQFIICRLSNQMWKYFFFLYIDNVTHQTLFISGSLSQIVKLTTITVTTCYIVQAMHSDNLQ